MMYQIHCFWCLIRDSRTLMYSFSITLRNGPPRLVARIRSLWSYFLRTKVNYKTWLAGICSLYNLAESLLLLKKEDVQSTRYEKRKCKSWFVNHMFYLIEKNRKKMIMRLNWDWITSLNEQLPNFSCDFQCIFSKLDH